MKSILALAAAMLAVQDAPDPAATPASPAMEQAIANRARVKTSPRWKKRVQPDTPAAAREKGAHGKVVVSLIIGTDGHPAEIAIKQSSRSPELDAAALDAASRLEFEPALDADGAPLAIPLQAGFDFSNVWKTSKMADLVEYRCDQFVRDQDWWAANWPGEKEEVYTLAAGLEAAPIILDARAALKPSTLKERWAAAIAECRTAPDKRVFDLLDPEGERLRRMAAMGL